jgi:hypothetical protein
MLSSRVTATRVGPDTLTIKLATAIELQERGFLMGRARFLLVAAMLCAASSAEGSRPSKPAIPLSIRAPEESAKPGSEITITATLTNLGKQDFVFADINPDCDYLFEVQDPTGKAAPETDYKKNLNCAGRTADSRNIRVRLRPGESRSEQLLITREYEFTLPGRYLIRAFRRFGAQTGAPTVKSNSLTITIIK